MFLRKLSKIMATRKKTKDIIQKTEEKKYGAQYDCIFCKIYVRNSSEQHIVTTFHNNFFFKKKQKIYNFF